MDTGSTVPAAARRSLGVSSAGGGRLDRPGALEPEAGIAVGGDLLAALAVRADTARVGHEHPRLAGDVGAEVPRVGEHEHRLAGDVVDVRHPLDLGLLV